MPVFHQPDNDGIPVQVSIKNSGGTDDKKIIMATAMITLFAANTLAFIEIGASSLTPWLLLAGLSLSAFLLYMNRRGNCDNFLVWRDEHSVGIEAMDKDHKKLLNLINNLRACILCTTGEEFERHNLNELIAYTRYHLKADPFKNNIKRKCSHPMPAR